MTTSNVDTQWVDLMEAAYKPGISHFSEEPFKVANDRNFQELGLRDEYIAQHISYIRTRRTEVLPVPTESGSPYTPLRSNTVIRLLVVQPGAFDDALLCGLRSVDFAFEYQYNARGEGRKTRFVVDLQTGELIRYTALSYVWGPPEFTSTMYCNGCAMKITPTLETAIRYLRDGTSVVHLWTDQICINQSDISEKQIQITCMDMVYKRAYNTAIWLGAKNTTIAFEVLKAVRSFWQFNTEELSEEAYRRFEEVLSPILLSKAWQSLKDLFENDWFTRAWTIQECALSLVPYIVMGHDSISWDEFASCCMTLDDSGFWPWLESQHETLAQRPTRAREGLESIKLIASLKSYLDSSEPSEFTTSSLVSTRYAQATNKRDKVYAILGLVKSDLRPDYALDIGETYRYVTAFEISSILNYRRDEHMAIEALSTEDKQRRGTLLNEPAHASYRIDLTDHDIQAILCCVDHPPDSKSRPSWVPDWSQPRQTHALGYTTSSCNIYAAGRLIKEPELLISDDGKTLHLRSGVIDKIKRVSEPTSEPVLSYEADTLKNSHFASLIEFAATGQPSAYGEELFAAFWQTCVAGRDAGAMLRCLMNFAEIFSLLIDEATDERNTLPGQLYTPRRQKGYFNLNNLKSRKPAEFFRDLQIAYRNALRNRSLCITEQGRLGLVPAFARAGDHICLIPTFSVPFLLRPTSELHEYELIGECFVHGVMNGEACSTAKMQPINLV